MGEGTNKLKRTPSGEWVAVMTKNYLQEAREYLGFKAFKILKVIEHNSQLHNDECKRT